MSMFDVITSSRRRFSPLQLSPALWLDASDASTLYDATIGGSLVAADGVVARWEDKSGNARHATQATSGSRPLRKTSVQNSRDVLQFDGLDDLLTPASNPMMSATAGTFFIVAHNDEDPPTNSIRAGHPYGVANGGGSHMPWTDGTIYEWFGTTVRKTTVNPTPSLASPYLYSVLSAASNYRTRLNGSQIFSTTDNIVGGGGYGIGTGPAYAYKGRIAEILVFPTALSDTNRQSVESYLNAKWAIY